MATRFDLQTSLPTAFLSVDVLIAAQDAVLAGDISPDFSVMATGSMDRTCRLWDLRSGNCLYVLQRHTNWVKVVKFGPKGRRLVSAGLDCKVVVWKVRIYVDDGDNDRF